jgi:type IX secretion system PorP/SprF family membrane protein
MNTNFRKIGIFLLLFVAGNIFAQQDPQFSQYIFTQNYLNPAAAALGNSQTIQVLHRSQYLGYAGSFDPTGVLKTQLVSAQMPLGTNQAIGLNLVNDVAGAQSNQNAKISYARLLKVAKGKLSVGVSAGIFNRGINNDLRPREAGDNNVPVGFSQIKPDLGIGAYYEAGDYFIGIAANHLNSPSFDFGTNNGKSVLNRTMSFLVGANMNAGPNVILKPTIQIRSDAQTLTYDTGLLAEIKNKYWLGGSFRNQDAVSALAGLSLLKNNTLKLGFAYDLITSNASLKAPGSIEALVSYAIGTGKKDTKVNTPKPIMRTPRFRHN